jgi:hypothetical protein
VIKSEKAAATNKKYRIINLPFFASNEARKNYQLQPKLATIRSLPRNRAAWDPFQNSQAQQPAEQPRE